ncbi:insulin-like peptide receptor [Anopheles aquasalis]|uniref:insulin-like peptide receptor n=1 Tax=Anopheles aquasalis TaxID=42839 RepID=UPI00215A86A0|nr:insulin-like peptide receptor [Anopheles aquasalis]
MVLSTVRKVRPVRSRARAILGSMERSTCCSLTVLLFGMCCCMQLLVDGVNVSISNQTIQPVNGGSVLSVTEKLPAGRNVSDPEENDNCTDVDIRNDLHRLRQIENCTVINGFFHMVLIERVPSEEFDRYVFTKLREVTGHMLFFRVINLVSLRKMFPNLMIIRGQQLLGPYALVFYYMTNMIEIGLKNLYSIQRGAVFSLHCPLLCHLDTINWTAIANGTKMMNSFETPKTVCNKAEVCRGCEQPFCWGSQNCQKFYKGHNFNGRIKCHAECLGGCVGNKSSECLVCRGWKEGDQCVSECSAERLQFRLTNRCITVDSCLRRGGLLHGQECVLQCPAGYSPTNVDEEVADFSLRRCFPCEPSCPKVCPGAVIMYLSDADRLHGCTIVNGTLHIRMSEDHPNLEGELQSRLGAIEDIMGILKVFRSNYIASLDFLTNLKIIHGLYTTDNSNFSLMVYENSNLQRLWNFEKKHSLQLVSRGVYFRNNPMLCTHQIQLLLGLTNHNTKNDTIVWASNGYQQACTVKSFTAKAAVQSARNVTIVWYNNEQANRTTGGNSSQADNHGRHQLLGYLIFYMRLNQNRSSAYEGSDVCSRYGWRSRFVALDKAIVRGTHYMYNLTRLKPYTRYAFYVRTYYNESLNSTAEEVGLSDVREFTTKKDRPTSPLHLHTKRKTNHTVTLGWKLLATERDMVTRYHIDVFIQPDEADRLDQRNYCHDPFEYGGGGGTMDGGTTTEPLIVTLCSEEYCCEVEDLDGDDEDDGIDDEEDEEDDNEEDGEQRGQMYEGSGQGDDGPQVDETGRNWGRRRKRFIGDWWTGSASMESSDRGFEMMMLRFQRGEDEETVHRHDNEFGAARWIRDTGAKQSDNTFVNRIYSYGFESATNEFTVTKLQPYRHYVFQLFACAVDEEKVKCSSYSLHSERTLPSPLYDQLELRVGPARGVTAAIVRGSALVLHFAEPKMANGLTLAYYVELRSTNDTIGINRTECITRSEHALQKGRYTFTNVPPGEYLVRAQAVSLAGAGPPTEWLFVLVLPSSGDEDSGGHIPPSDTKVHSLRDGLIAFGVLLVLALITAAGYCWWSRKMGVCRFGGSDDKVPLAENDANEQNAPADDGFVNCSLK